jgi:hypothetical protein
MAKYGLDYYGIGKYGSGAASVVDFDASPVVASSVGYRQIKVSWIPPSGDWSTLRLVRNTYGFPLTVDDGATVLEEIKNFSLGSFTDTGEVPNNIGLRPGIAYHYSIFVFGVQNNVWIKAGEALGLSVKDFGSFDAMYDNIPSVYKSTNLKSVTDNGSNPDLESFLRIFAIGYDSFKTSADLVLKTYDTAIAYAPIIPVMMQQFGVAYEPELGLQQSRILLRNAVYINEKKGSLQGIQDFVKAFTGYDEETVTGKNLMLDYNDSSFEESIGRWANIAKTTLSVADATTVTPYEETTRPSLFPNKQAGSLKALCSSSGDMEFACGLSAPKTRGVPVKEGFPYTFSIYTRKASTARKVTVDVRWFDRTGLEISRAGEKYITNTAAWKRVETTSVAPVNSYFAVPYVRIDGASSSEIHYFDAAQFEINAEGATDFEEARELKITLKATRVNEFKNPSFELQVLPWVASNAIIARDLTIVDEDRGSEACLLITPSTSAEVVLTYDDYLPVLGGYWYTSSAYFRTAFIGDREDDFQGHWGITWYDANQVEISEDFGDPTNLTEFYPVQRYSRTGGILTVYTEETTSFAESENVRLVGFPESGLDGTYTISAAFGSYFQVISAGADFVQNTPPICWAQDLKLDFVRNEYSTLSPDNAAYAKPYFMWDNALSTQTLRIDSGMFERATAAKPYFDGSTGFTSSNDLIWENGDTYNARSHYYKNRVATQLRLIAQLPNYLVAGTPFSVYLAQPDA